MFLSSKLAAKCSVRLALPPGFGVQVAGVSSERPPDPKQNPMFSVLRLIRSVVEARTGTPTGAEINHALKLAEEQRALGRDARLARGYFMPPDALDDPLAAERRAALSPDAGFAAGGAWAAGGNMPGDPIPALRPQRWSMKAGVVEVDGLEGTGEVSLPRHSGVSTAHWVRNGEAVPESDEDTASVVLSPHHVGATTTLSRGFLNQSSVSAEAWARRALRESVDDAIDRALLRGDPVGSGLEEPLGIAVTPGVHDVALATAGQPTRPEILQLREVVAAAGVRDPDTVSFVYGPGMGRYLRSASSDTGSGNYLLESAGRGGLAGLDNPRCETSHADDSLLVCGDFTTTVVGRWATPWDLVIDPFTHARTGKIALTLYATCDLAFGQPAAFAVGRKAA